MKRVLLITQYFYPESFKSNDLAFELVKRGYMVDALVGIPNYPEGHYYNGYGIFKKRHEVVNGVNIYRCWQTPRKLFPGGIGMFLNYFTFVISSVCYILFFFAFKKKYDELIIHQPGPISQAIPAVLLKLVTKTPKLSIWVMDLWPNVLKSAGVKSKFVYKCFTLLVAWIYRNCDRIMITSKMFADEINTIGDFHDKIIYFPNWSDDSLSNKKDYNLPIMPEGFIIMMAGNLGKTQNLDVVSKLILELKDNCLVKWVFVGDGSMKLWLDQFIVDNHLEKIAFTVGRHPGYAMPSFFERADAMLLTLKGDFKHQRIVVPARLQSYMSSGKPILAMIGEGGQAVIKDADCGYAVNSGNYKELASIIRNQVLPNVDEFKSKGVNGRLYYKREFTKDKCIDNLCKIIN